MFSVHFKQLCHLTSLQQWDSIYFTKHFLWLLLFLCLKLRCSNFILRFLQRRFKRNTLYTLHLGFVVCALFPSANECVRSAHILSALWHVLLPTSHLLLEWWRWLGHCWARCPSCWKRWHGVCTQRKVRGPAQWHDSSSQGRTGTGDHLKSCWDSGASFSLTTAPVRGR